MHATITLAQSGGRLPGILSCPSVSPHPVPARGAPKSVPGPLVLPLTTHSA